MLADGVGCVVGTAVVSAVLYCDKSEPEMKLSLREVSVVETGPLTGRTGLRERADGLGLKQLMLETRLRATEKAGGAGEASACELYESAIFAVGLLIVGVLPLGGDGFRLVLFFGVFGGDGDGDRIPLRSQPSFFSLDSPPSVRHWSYATSKSPTGNPSHSVTGHESLFSDRGVEVPLSPLGGVGGALRVGASGK